MMAPDFEAIGLDGKKFKLSDFRGKKVVIDFWNLERNPTQLWLSDRKLLVERMRGKPFVLLSVGDEGETWGVAGRTLDKKELTWPNAVDGPKRTLTHKWGIRSWPTQYLLDAKGKILMKSEKWWVLQGIAEFDKEGHYTSINQRRRSSPLARKSGGVSA